MFIKKFAEFLFDESDTAAEEKSRWKPTKSGEKKSRSGYSSVDKYTFLKSFAGNMESKGKKLMQETVIVDEVDDSVKERIIRSDAALQSSSSNYNLKNSDRAQSLHLADNELVSIISDDDDDNSSIMSFNDLADVEGTSGEQELEHKITSHEMESSVVVHPECVRYGQNCYCKAQLTFLCSSIKLNVSEEGATGSLTFEWKTLDLISIESRWLDPFITAELCLRIKSEQPRFATSGQKSGILEVKSTVSDLSWTCIQDRIKSLDEQYKEKWDVDLDSYESFEDVTYLEGDCDSISITKRDFQLLQPEKFINDTIVDFYIEYLKKMKPVDARIHFFNSFFFRKLADFDENQSRVFDAKSAFQRVRKWTKKVNIFQKDYIFIPVNFRLHWSLIVICHPGEVVNFSDEELVNSPKVPCILHMDSIKGSHRGLENCIRCYLWEEWKERSNGVAEDNSTKFLNLQFLRLEVPQQQNSYDCGLFMLHYMELFVKQAPINFNPLNSFVNKDWFYPTEASLKRARIKRLIFELSKSKVSSPGSNDKSSSSYELKDEDEEEAEVEILHETCNSKENIVSDTCVNRSPIMAKPLRSEPYLCSADVNINHLDGDINGVDTDTLMTSFQELQSQSEELPETGDKEGSLIAEIDQNHGQLVLYDLSFKVLSPIKESDETEEDLDKQVVVATGPLTNPETNKIESCMTCIDKSMNLLQLKENHPPEQCSSSSPGDGVREALIVEDSDDDVFETCVVDDSDSDDSGEAVIRLCKNSSIPKDVPVGNRLNVEASKRRLAGGVSEARKRVRRSWLGDLQVISPFE